MGGIPLWSVTLYLALGVALAEGSRWAAARQGTTLLALPYLIIVLFWPALIVFLFVKQILSIIKK